MKQFVYVSHFVCVCRSPPVFIVPFHSIDVVETPWLIGSESVVGATCFSTVCMCLYTKLAQGCFVCMLIIIPM